MYVRISVQAELLKQQKRKFKFRSVIQTAGQNNGSCFLMSLESWFNVQSFVAFACQWMHLKISGEPVLDLRSILESLDASFLNQRPYRV